MRGCSAHAPRHQGTCRIFRQTLARSNSTMCGIAGYLRLSPDGAPPLAANVAGEMLAAIRRRGPDGEGQWRSGDGLAWLGHRRLAIIDLETGDQPMSNEDGTVWTAFNG